jgi:hypothetical protein
MFRICNSALQTLAGCTPSCTFRIACNANGKECKFSCTLRVLGFKVYGHAAWEAHGHANGKQLELKVQFLKGALCQLLSDYNSNFSVLLPPAFCLVPTNIGWFWDLGQFQGIQTTGSTL